MHIDALLSPPEIDLLPQRKAELAGALCIVFDVLRATSSMLTGLAHSVREIRPALTIEEAINTRETWARQLAEKAEPPGEPAKISLGGERHGERIDGFDLGNSPLEYCAPGLERIVTTTNNGTVALRACAAAGAAAVWAGAFLNMGALVERLRLLHSQRERSPKNRPADSPQAADLHVMLVCAGTFRGLALEDLLAAGMLADAFPEAALTDAAQTTRALYREHRADIAHGLRQSRNGRALLSRSRAADVDWCAQVSRFPVIGMLGEDGILRKV